MGLGYWFAVAALAVLMLVVGVVITVGTGYGLVKLARQQPTPFRVALWGAISTGVLGILLGLLDRKPGNVIVTDFVKNLLIYGGGAYGLQRAWLWWRGGGTISLPKHKALSKHCETASFITFSVGGVAGIGYSLHLLSEHWGSSAFVLGLFAFPITGLVVPWYALFVWGDAKPFLYVYGGMVLAFVLMKLNEVTKPDSTGADGRATMYAETMTAGEAAAVHPEPIPLTKATIRRRRHRAPDSTQASAALKIVEVADYYHSVGQYERAIELYAQACEEGIRTPALFRRVAATYRAMGDEETARLANLEAEKAERGDGRA